MLIKVLGPGFFAREDTVTPVKIAALCVAINLGLDLLLMGPLLRVGIALATAISTGSMWGFCCWFCAGAAFGLDARLRQAIPHALMAALDCGGHLATEALADFAASDVFAQGLALAPSLRLGLRICGCRRSVQAARLSDIKRVLDGHRVDAITRRRFDHRENKMDRIFSGVQPTGNLHHKLSGRDRNFVGLQSDYECIYCVVVCTPSPYGKTLRSWCRTPAR